MQKIIVPSDLQGVEIAKDKIYESVDEKTVLFLSGGSTPKLLYQTLAKEKKLKVGVVAMVDERYFTSEELKTKSGKLNSTNEKMMQDSGLLNSLTLQHIPFYSIVRQDLRLHPKGVNIKDEKELAKEYNGVVDQLLRRFTKSIAILGIGSDGHTAGLPAGKSQISNLKSQKYVTDVKNFPGEFKKRVTLTFRALSQMDLMIVLVFGEEKREALRQMFEEGKLEEIPARFYKKPEIAKKTLLITDQKI